MSESQHRRESEFHNAWALEANLDECLVEPFFQSVTALENQFILEKMGSLKGLTVLDIGCGFGEASVYFALQGAHVTAIDVSSGMVQAASKLAAQRGTNLQTVVCVAESLPFESESFDCVYAANIIHHTSDKELLVAEIRRVLKNGGTFFSWDPLSYNPLIKVYRVVAKAVRSADEKPLDVRDINLVKKYFPTMRFRTFWILSLLLFLKYLIVDRLHPGIYRYWKLIYRENERTLWWWLPLKNADQFLGNLPGVQFLAWNIVMWARK